MMKLLFGYLLFVSHKLHQREKSVPKGGSGWVSQVARAFGSVLYT